MSKCCNDMDLKETCGVDMSDYVDDLDTGEIQSSGFEGPRLWTWGELLINFKNERTEATELKDLKEMRSELGGIKRLDYDVEYAVDREDNFDDKFMKILELCISPYTRFQRFNYVHRYTINDSSRLDNNVEGVINVTYKPSIPGITASATVGKPKTNNFINVTTSNRGIYIKEGINNPIYIYIALDIKAYKSIDEFILMVNSKFLEAYNQQDPSKKLNFLYTAKPIQAKIYSFKLQIFFTNNNPPINVSLGVSDLTIGNPLGFIKDPAQIFKFYRFTKYNDDPLDNIYKLDSIMDIQMISITNTTFTIYKFQVSTIIHEFLHILGMCHTHQTTLNNPLNQDGWDIKTMRKYIMKKTNKSKEEAEKLVYNNYISRIQVGKEVGMPFDPLSIMTYKIKNCWNTADIRMDKNYKLSKNDKLGLCRIYGGGALAPCIALEAEPYEYSHNFCSKFFIQRFILIFMLIFTVIFTVIIIIKLLSF